MTVRPSPIAIAAAGLFAFAALSPSAPLAQRLVPTEDPLHPRAMYADSLVSLNDRCIVAGNKLSVTIRPVYVSGAPIGFCCTRCPGVFSEDPDRYLTMREVEVPCAVYPSRKAVLTPATRAQINHEVFFFSDAEAREKFMKDPLRYCGLLTDPVNRARFRPDADSPRFEFGERPYYFSTDSTLKAFQGSPENYANRSGA
jgi:YHS domain-containing protein